MVSTNAHGLNVILATKPMVSPLTPCKIPPVLLLLASPLGLPPYPEDGLSQQEPKTGRCSLDYLG